MKRRDAKLQLFYDLTETAISRPAETCANAGPTATPVFDALRMGVGEQGNFAQERLPVSEALESASDLASTAPAPIPELAAALNDLSPYLQWKRRNASPPAGGTLHDGLANALGAGLGGLEDRDEVGVGISLLALYVRYPDHRHHPEVVNVSLAGGAWWNSNMKWTTPVPGGIIYNEPNVLHIMRTEEQPLLAIWCLWISNQKQWKDEHT
jgi:hypothetical protein